MWKILFIVLVFVLFVTSAVSAPLVFKTTKQMKESGDMLTFDASKYKKIRIGIYLANPSPQNEKQTTVVRIFSVEGEDSIYAGMVDVGGTIHSGDFLIDTPAPKIKISALRAGTYKIYIWAE